MKIKKRAKGKDTSSLFGAALQHHQAGQFGQAESIYREILATDSAHADSLHLLGMIGFQCGKFEDSCGLIRQAIAVRPNVPLFHCNLGVVMNASGKLAEAIESYKRALALNPDYVEAHSNMGTTLTAQGRHGDAIEHFERALLLNPNNAETHVNLGAALAEQGYAEKATPHYLRALKLNPQCPEAWCNLANAYQALNELAHSVDCYQRALALKPNYAGAICNLGNLCQAQDQIDAAIECYNRALGFDPDFVQALHGKALAKLVNGNFAEGWREYEIRWRTAGHTSVRQYKQPLWKGDCLSAGNVLIWPEQGIGDEIMFGGLVPDVLRTGNSCVLECDPRLKPLFARSFPNARVVSRLDSEIEFAEHLPMGSLPGIFRNNETDFDATTAPYLTADSHRVRLFRTRYECGKLLVGLAWYTKNPKTGLSRSIDLSLFAPLFARTDVQFVSLQYGDHNELEKAVAAAPIMIDRAVDQLADVDGFAAQIAALDLVITIDNSTAHLAGALGAPTWVLLPLGRDWRWLREREDSPWYPTMRLFRQHRSGDWQAVIESVGMALSKLKLTACLSK